MRDFASVCETNTGETKVLSLYKKNGAEFVQPEIGQLKLEVLKAELVSNEVYIKSVGDLLHRSLLRHDSDKLAKIIYELGNKNYV